MKAAGISSKKYNKDEYSYAGLCNYSSRAVTRLAVYRAIEVAEVSFLQGQQYTVGCYVLPRGGQKMIFLIDTFDESASKVNCSWAETF